ncbi:MAG: helix-turn-helix transcriptional regulator [Pirellulaceae bacterium]|nr:helix-turn-helix transcriptional regulator [Pirellulaceae bacterium]
MGADPVSSLAARQKTEVFNRRYGAAIRRLRMEAGLKQSDIAGLTERNLRRVEHGQLAASKSTLQSLANAHGMALEDYLDGLALGVKGA